MSGSGALPTRLQERGFGLTLGFGRRPGLLVIDLINGFTDPSQPLGAELGPQIAATNELLAAAHGVGLPVFFTTVAYDAADLADAGLWRIKAGGATTLRSGTPAVELDARLDRAPNDHLVVKKYASAFFGTDLLSRLVFAGVDTLVIAGCTTSGCVRASAVDALQNGIRPIVVEEAIGDRDRAAHEQSIWDMRLKYADVVGLSEAAASLRAASIETE